MNSWSCLPSEQHRDNARQCCRVHRLARHRGQSHDKQHRLGGRWEIVNGVVFGFHEFVFHFFWDLWHSRNVVSAIFLLLFAERFCSNYYPSFFWKCTFDINKNLNTDTAALKEKYIPKIQEGEIFPISYAVVQRFEGRRSQNLPTFFLIFSRQVGAQWIKRAFMWKLSAVSPGVPLLLLTGWSLDQSWFEGWPGLGGSAASRRRSSVITTFARHHSVFKSSSNNYKNRYKDTEK